VEQRFGRRQFLKGALVVGAAAAGGAFPVAAEAATPDAERLTFSLPGLDAAHDGLRIAQLSDIHVGPKTPRELIRAAVDAANAFDPDLVVLTGDFLCHRKREVADLREQLGGLAAPTVAVLGNHDVWVDPTGAAAALRGHGYEVLENQWTRITLRGEPLHVVGVGDTRTGREDVRRATAGLPKGVSPLVLAHGPTAADRVAALRRPALCLSGHTHGGQISIPIVTPLLLGTFGRQPYLRGRYRIGDVQLYVNRGVGMSGIRMRVNSPPEVTLATLRAAAPA
jgi:hypothetical protein